jgi:hypothetical protein
MRAVRRLLISAIAASIASMGLQPAIAQQEAQGQRVSANEVLTDAAVIALIIAGSIAAYKAMGRPCACPEDFMRNGRICGGNSAWSRPGGFKPLCYAKDVSPAMIAAYRATKTIPPLH